MFRSTLALLVIVPPLLCWSGSSVTGMEPRSSMSLPRATIDGGARESYLRILETWALGDEKVATRLLVELEIESDSHWGDMGPEALRGTILRVAEELGQLQPDLLLPLSDLQLRCYAEHWRTGSWEFAYRSRTTAYQLANRFTAGVNDERQREMAADLLAALGSYFHQSSSLRAAGQLYARSLEFDSRNQEALLGLATLSEQQGKYSRAVDLLDRLVQVRPYDLEAQLRRALNVGRTGDIEESLALLERITSGEHPDWVVLLAYQELARRFLALDSTEEAFKWADEGSQRFPEDQGLLVTGTYLRERLGKPDDTLDIAEKLNRCAERCRPAVRFQYSQLQDAVPEQAHARLQSHSVKLRSDLRDALAHLRSADRS